MRTDEAVDPATSKNASLPLIPEAKTHPKQIYGVASPRPPQARTLQPIAIPENRLTLQQEIERCEPLGQTRDHKKIVLYRCQGESPVMREIGRLREEVFRRIGEGTGKHRDIDAYDPSYLHIVLWDEHDLEIVGAYRLCSTHQVIHDGDSILYTQTLFDYQPDAKPILQAGLELGRSFVQPRYWGSRSLEYLWYGISAFLRRNPQYRYLFGAVSISNVFSSAAKDLMVGYYQKYYGTDLALVVGKRPYMIDAASRKEIDDLFQGASTREAFFILKQQLGHMGFSVPVLYKQYSELCKPGGTVFSGFNIDPDFNDCVDGLVVVDITHISEIKKKRYGLTDHVVTTE